MKTSATCCIVVLILCASVARAAEQPRNPLETQLFPPELIMQHREELGLSEQQVTKIRGHLEEVQTTGAEVHKKLETATAKLGAALGKESVAEAEALKHL